MQKSILAIKSFPPIIEKNARILILGSMPSEASLKANEYYAHPRNQFWGIMSELLGYCLPMKYSEKKQMLIKNKVALWDVIYSCQRTGSLDSKITDGTINNLDRLLLDHKRIEVIFLNGKKAYHTFRKEYSNLDIPVYDLPSTSPAYTKPFLWKLKRWQIIKEYLK